MTLDEKLVLLMFKMHGHVPIAMFFVGTQEVSIISTQGDFRKLAADIGLEFEEEE